MKARRSLVAPFMVLLVADDIFRLVQDPTLWLTWVTLALSVGLCAHLWRQEGRDARGTRPSGR